MLAKIIDTSRVDTRDLLVNLQLRIDLTKRIPRMDHSGKPDGATHLRIEVFPSNSRDGFWYHFNYGCLGANGNFTSLGETRVLNHEQLPYVGWDY